MGVVQDEYRERPYTHKERFEKDVSRLREAHDEVQSLLLAVDGYLTEFGDATTDDAHTATSLSSALKYTRSASSSLQEAVSLLKQVHDTLND